MPPLEFENKTQFHLAQPLNQVSLALVIKGLKKAGVPEDASLQIIPYPSGQGMVVKATWKTDGE